MLLGLLNGYSFKTTASQQNETATTEIWGESEMWVSCLAFVVTVNAAPSANKGTYSMHAQLV